MSKLAFSHNCQEVFYFIRNGSVTKKIGTYSCLNKKSLEQSTFVSSSLGEDLPSNGVSHLITALKGKNFLGLYYRLITSVNYNTCIVNYNDIAMQQFVA